MNNFNGPHLEAEIYYLTEAEGGRKTAVASGYRGQFFYDGRDWDAPQEFIDKEYCNPGEKVQVKLTTLSPIFHIGKFEIGKEFNVREGARTVGLGKITKVLHPNLKYWDFATFLEQLPNECQPYDKVNIDGFITDIEYALGKLETIKKLEFNVTLGNFNQMLTVHCLLKDQQTGLRPLIDEIYHLWEKDIRFEKAFSKIELQTIQKGYVFELIFATYHSMYVTGKIVIEFVK